MSLKCNLNLVLLHLFMGLCKVVVWLLLLLLVKGYYWWYLLYISWLEKCCPRLFMLLLGVYLLTLLVFLVTIKMFMQLEVRGFVYLVLLLWPRLIIWLILLIYRLLKLVYLLFTFLMVLELVTKLIKLS